MNYTFEQNEHKNEMFIRTEETIRVEFLLEKCQD